MSDKEFRGWWLMHLARQPSVVNLALVGVGIIYCKETLVCAHAILLLIGRSRLCTSVRHLAGAGIDSFQTQDGNPISSCHESALCARVQNGMPSVALPQRPAAAALKRAHRTTARHIRAVHHAVGNLDIDIHAKHGAKRKHFSRRIAADIACAMRCTCIGLLKHDAPMCLKWKVCVRSPFPSS